MHQTTVRLRETAHAKLRTLARAEKRPMNDVLEEAIEAYRRARFLAEVNAGYAALRQDPEADASFRAEMAQLDGSLLDGLPADEPPATPKPKRPRRRAARR